MIMEELTIEEKARLYDEAIERGKRMFSAKELKYLFPELEKSVDESIRKKLLSAFKGIMADADEDELWYGMPYSDIIDWLEKQGNTKSTWSEEDLDKILTGFMGRYAYENGGEYPSAIDIAKHFFELGLKAQKGK